MDEELQSHYVERATLLTCARTELVQLHETALESKKKKERKQIEKFFSKIWHIFVDNSSKGNHIFNLSKEVLKHIILSEEAFLSITKELGNRVEIKEKYYVIHLFDENKEKEIEEGNGKTVCSLKGLNFNVQTSHSAIFDVVSTSSSI